MKILFSALHFAYFRNFESVVLALAARGHDVHLMADEAEALGGEQFVRCLAAQSPRIRWSWAPPVAEEPWFPVARKLRHALDYVRFLEPRYDGSPKLRLRTAERAPRAVRWLGRVPALRRTPVRAAVAGALMQLERQMPLSDAALAFLKAEAPDVLLLTSMTYARAPQFDHHKAARALGIPVGHCVMSWDHLSSKSLLHLVPDRMFVWNEVQRREAADMHPIPAERVVVTGAQCYDQWFDRAPSRSRTEFCAAYGFDPSKPVLLYACSAMSPQPDPLEPVFVRSWVEALRSSPDQRVREASILIRPHPERVKEWRDVDLSGRAGVVVGGRNPIDAGAKAEYYDSLYHADAVVGICTTVFIEATIVGRPVFAFLAPQFRIHQDAMQHFRYLVEVEGGVLQTAETFELHIAQLARALDGDRAMDDRRRRFVETFLRPGGIETEATPAFVTAVEELASTPAPAMAEAGRWFAPLLAPAARRLARHDERGLVAWLLKDERELAAELEERGKAQSRQGRIEANELRRREELAAREEMLRAKQAQQRAKRRRRLWRQLRHDVAMQYHRGRTGAVRLVRRTFGDS